ncbi:hypothetical protein ACFFIS_14935 [Virgibacillus soli]
MMPLHETVDVTNPVLSITLANFSYFIPDGGKSIEFPFSFSKYSF